MRVLQMDNTKNFSIHHGNGTVVIYSAFFENAPNPKIKSLFALAQKWFRTNAGVIARMSEHLYMRREECRKDAAVAKKNYSDLYRCRDGKMEPRQQTRRLSESRNFRINGLQSK